jgi:predicted nucleotidyltransferase
MERIVTLTERKAAKAERRRLAVEALRAVLTDYARAHGGRFMLFGSAARGDMRAGSDVDVLTDFPRDATDDAWVFAEDACRALGLTPDIRPVSWCGRSFLDHILPELEALG